jgi:hypothetical protein
MPISCDDPWFVDPMLSHAARQGMLNWSMLSLARRTCQAWSKILDAPMATRARDFMGMASDQDVLASRQHLVPTDVRHRLDDPRGTHFLGMCTHVPSSRAWLVRALEKTSIGERSLCDASTLWLLCQNGDMEITRLVDRHFKLDRSCVTQETRSHCRLFLGTCWRGKLEMARWLAERFNLSSKEAQAHRAFQHACMAGATQHATWIIDFFRLTEETHWGSEQQSKSGCLMAYQSGKLSLIKAVTDRFDLNPTNLREGARLLVAAGEQGIVEVFDWVVDRFQLSRKHVATNGWTLLRNACRRGHLELVKHLTKRFNITSQNVRVHKNAAFRRAVAGGHLEMSIWLATSFNLTVTDARSNRNNALQQACTQGYLSMAQWLVNHFGMTEEDVRSQDNTCVRGAMRNCHVDVVVWIAKTFGVNSTNM